MRAMLLAAGLQAVLAAPPEVRCVRIVAVAGTRTVVRDFGGGPHVLLQDAPSGSVLLFGSAWASACADSQGTSATWFAEETALTLDAGAAASVVVPFRPNGVAALSIDYGGQPSAADAQCLQISVVGATRTVTRALDSGGPSLQLEALPTGSVLLLLAAFAPACADVTTATSPSWIADPLSATLVAGQPIAIATSLHR